MTTQSLNPADVQWSDGKRYLWLLSPMIPVLALAGFALFLATGWGVFTWSAFILLYGVIPLLDWLVGVDQNNPPESVVRALEEDRYYRNIVFAFVPMQYVVTALGAWLAVRGDLAAWEYVGVLLTTGAVNGVAINTAHELGHKKESVERWMAKLTLAPVAYGHFFIEHNKGHHKNVATPHDPASSKMGESFWVFLPRTVIGSLRSAWGIEKERLQRNGKSVFNTGNENLQAWAMTVVFFAALTLWLGWAALPFLLLQAAYGASLLETVNYLEHYGLLRQYDAKTGRYERCQPHHSWNSNHIVTNLFLYQLQRHSDHHANPTRRYQALRHFENTPQLPSGYASMLLLAYFPPLWYRLMDPKVAAHFKGDLSKANIYEPKRAKLMARWHRAAAPKAAASSTVEDVTLAAPVEATRFQCPNCEYVYDEAQGCPHEGFAPGTRWAMLPASWPCPSCAVREKPDFKALS